MPSVSDVQIAKGDVDGGMMAAKGLKREPAPVEHTASTSSSSSKAPKGEELASMLHTTSLDGRRTTLVELLKSTALHRYDERPESGDGRIRVAIDFLRAGDSIAGRRATMMDNRSIRGLMQAWDESETQRQPAILPLALNCMANLITLLGVHQPNHELAEGLICILLPSTPFTQTTVEEARVVEPYWNRLQKYLSESGAAFSRVKGKQPQPASGATGTSDETTLAVLQLLLAITTFAGAKYARAAFEGMTWSMRSLSRLLNMRRRATQRKRDAKKNLVSARGSPSLASLDKPDIRTAWILVLLSFLRHPSGGCTSAALRIAALSLGREYYPAVFKGLTKDPAPIVAHILMGLHDGLLSGSASVKLPRSKVVSIFNEWTCKALVELYERERDLLRLSQSDEQHSVADIAHHFLLALCTHPGRGVCFIDDGWYGKAAERSGTDEQGENATNTTLGIYNKILYGVLRSLWPTRSPKQGELALRILSASPELTGPYLRTWLSVEPKGASISWLSASTFFCRAMSESLPSFRDEAGKWRAVPPSRTACVDATLPSPINKAMFVRGINVPDRFARLASVALLCRVLTRLLAFRRVCRMATQDDAAERATNSAGGWTEQLELCDDAALDGILTGQLSQRTNRAGLWKVRWEEVLKEAKDRLPDLSSLLASVSGIKGKALEGQIETVERDSALVEATLRSCWLLQELLEASAILTTADLDALAAYSFPDAHRTHTLHSLTSLHAMRTVAAHCAHVSGGLDIFVRSSGGGGSYLGRLLRMQGSTSLPLLQITSQSLLRTAMLSSVLFEHDLDEWDAWQYALHDGSAQLYDFLDECAHRCLKTPYRYVEVARKAAAVGGATLVPHSEADVLASPLLFTMLEQYCIRTRKGFLDREPIRRSMLDFLGRLLPALVMIGRGPSALFALIDECHDAVKGRQFAESTMLARQADTIRYSVLALDRTSRSPSAGEQCSTDQLRYPLHENAFAAPGEGPLAAHHYAFHLRYAKKLTRAVSWQDARPIDAKLITAVAVIRMEEGKDVAALVAVCLNALQRGAMDHKFLRSFVFGSEIVKRNVRRGGNRLFLDALIRLAVEGPFSPADDAVKQLIAPLTHELARLAEEEDCANVAWEAIAPLAPFFDLQVLQQFARAIVSKGGHLGTVCLLAQSSKCPILSEDDVAGMVTRFPLAPDDALAGLRLLSLPLSSVDTEAGGAALLIAFILAQSNSPLADSALAMMIDRSPRRAGSVLDACASHANPAVLLQRMPFAIAHACQLARPADTHCAMVPLAHAAAAVLFSENSAVGAAAAKILGALMHSFDVDVTSDHVCAAIPDRPVQAFNVNALLLASDIALRQPLMPGHESFLHVMTEKALLWLVRRFAEDEEDSLTTIEGVQAFVELISRRSTVLSSLVHLVGPVLTAAIHRRLASPLHARLVRLLLSSEPLKSSGSTQQLLDEMLHSRIALSSATDVRVDVVAAVAACVERDADVVSAGLVAALVPLYGGSLSVSDRQIFRVFCLYEQRKGMPILDLLRRWSGNSALLHQGSVEGELIWRLDPTRILETCLRFPRARSFTDLSRSGYDFDVGEEATLGLVYDPLIILCAIGEFLSRKGRPPSGLQLVELLRTNALGFLACCLSSRQDAVRWLAVSALAKVYAFVRAATFHERQQLLVALDALRHALIGAAEPVTEQQHAPAPLPLTATLFVAHALRAQALPSLYLYPLTSRFLLQRAAPLDRTDVPLLYGFLFSSSHQSDTYHQQRLFILRFLTACLRYGGRGEWKIMKRRHVWHSVCSLYIAAGWRSVQIATTTTTTTATAVTIATADASLRHAIEELWQAASLKEHVALYAVVRLGFLEFVEQCLALHPPEQRRDRTFWSQLLCNLVTTIDLDRLQHISGTAWLKTLAKLFACLLHEPKPANSDAPVFLTEAHATYVADALLKLAKFLQNRIGEEAPLQTDDRRDFAVFAALTRALIDSVRQQFTTRQPNKGQTERQNRLIRITLQVAHKWQALCDVQAADDLRRSVDALSTGALA